MIRILLGNVGSGKTALAVRDIILSELPIYSNIITPRLKKNHVIKKEHIFKEEIVKVLKSGEVKTKTVLNSEYWHDLKKKHPAISVYIDEAHTLLNPRRSMSKKNEVMSDFLALLRRIVGATESGYGELLIISQLERRIDVIAKEMATVIQYCIGHYYKECKQCKALYSENNETPKKMMECTCGSTHFKKSGFIIEVFSFKNIDAFHHWFYSDRRSRTYFNREFVTNIELVFPYYDTLQWESLISD